MRTSISSNFSVPFCAEALVASGLDYLVVSLDGATADTYNKYRINGNFELVLSNISNVVEARRKLKSKTPYLVWQFLLFDHTQAEADLAEQIAERIGVDKINFAQPYDVSRYNAAINLPEKSLVRHRVFNMQIGSAQQSLANAIADLHPNIDEQWEILWQSQIVDCHTEHRDSTTCRWLYQDMVMDATGRILPCCFDPIREPTSIFGNIHTDIDPFNSINYLTSRKYFSRQRRIAHATACAACTENNSTPNINTTHLAPYFFYAGLTKNCFEDLANSNIFNWGD